MPSARCPDGIVPWAGAGCRCCIEGRPHRRQAKTSPLAASRCRLAELLLQNDFDSDDDYEYDDFDGMYGDQLLDDDNTSQAHEHAVAALARLAHESPDNQTQIAKKLVALLSTSDPESGEPQKHDPSGWEKQG